PNARRVQRFRFLGVFQQVALRPSAHGGSDGGVGFEHRRPEDGDVWAGVWPGMWTGMQDLTYRLGALDSAMCMSIGVRSLFSLAASALAEARHSSAHCGSRSRSSPWRVAR